MKSKFSSDVESRATVKLAELRALFRSGETPTFEHAQFSGKNNKIKEPEVEWPNNEDKDSTAGAL